MAKKRRQRQKLTEEEFASWIPIRKAIGQPVEIGGLEPAKQEIWSRLRAGILRSGAENWTINPNDPPGGVIEVEQDRWGSLQVVTDSWWQTGRVTLWRDEGNRTGHGYRRPTSAVEYFGMRVDPEGLMKFTGRPVPTTLKHAASDLASEEGKPRIRDDWLADWAALFNKLYPDKDADFAWRSAKGMFPDKSVSRDRVRPLVPRSRGRPSQKK